MTYRLPNGTRTASFEAYAEAWAAVYKPIERVTGYRCSGFDPGIALVKPSGMTTNIDTETAMILSEWIREHE